MSAAATVHLVDDDALFLRAMSRMLRAAGLEVRGFESAFTFLAQISPETRGCVVADLFMPGMSGLELQEELTRTGDLFPVVFLTGRGSISSTVRAMRGGAVDVLEKGVPEEILLAVIRRALNSSVIEHDARTRTGELRSRCSRLTQREREVLQHVVSGRMNKQIAASLGINERTVKLHRTSITTKLGVRSSAQLAVLTREILLFDSDRLSQIASAVPAVPAAGLTGARAVSA